MDRPVVPGKKGDKLTEHQKANVILEFGAYGDDCKAHNKAAKEEARKQGALIVGK